MCVASVLGPTHEVIVPSAYVPARRNIGVAEGRHEQRAPGAAPGTVTAALVRYCSPSNAAASPCSSGASTCRYSRMWRAGFSNGMPELVLHHHLVGEADPEREPSR